MSIEYEIYLQSPEWRQRRAERLRFAGHRCEVCNGRDGLEVHHRTYARLGSELMTDLVALCGDCHERFHDKLPAPPDRGEVIEVEEPAWRIEAKVLVERIRAAEAVGDRDALDLLIAEKMELMERRREGMGVYEHAT